MMTALHRRRSIAEEQTRYILRQAFFERTDKKNGLHQNKRLLVLTGNVGTGKTAVINTLLEKIDKNVIAVMIPDPALDSIDFYNILSNEFKMNKKFTSKEDFLSLVKPFLYETSLQGKTILLIIDEAQKISHGLLEELRQLSNIESPDTKPFNIIMVAQNEFNAIIDENRNSLFKRSIGIRYHLDPLNDSETDEYLNHRLKVAGAEKEIFSAEAKRDIHCLSAGVPRLINAICDLALLSGYSLGKDSIDEKIIKECAQELKISDGSEIMEEKERNSNDGMEQSFAARKPRPRFRKFDLAAAIVGVLLFMIFTIYDTYPVQSQSPLTKAEAFRDYKRYEEKIEHTKIEHAKVKFRFVKKEPVSKISEQKKNEKDVNKNIGSKNGFRQSDIIYFQNASKKLSNNNLETLDIFVESIRNYPNSEIIIEGHTDSRGNYWRNKKLSQIRANLVKNYFVNHGIISDRIKTIGLGAEYPMENNDAEMGAAKNHRVEIKLISPQQNIILSQSQ
jgi:type II secretory pathway predicted ATPase ExeA/outer membrane protein OmpA-like peptidoglycan-associated protein